MKNKVRLTIVQALYQREIAKTEIDQIIKDYSGWQKHLSDKPNFIHFENILRTVVENEQALDEQIAKVLPAEWKLDRIEKVLLVLLRAGLAEREDKTMLPDYVELAHSLLDKKPAAMANAILDKLTA